MSEADRYDVIVVGGGHAGTEAALAAARRGARTLLLTHSIDTLGQMSCNPAIGGIGKGHLVREIDAMGGAMGVAIDRAGIQFRTLNASKGAAVRATRAQADRTLYRLAIREAVESQPNLRVFQQGVDDLLVSGERVIGVRTQMGLTLRASSVVLTVGTFLGGRLHVGESSHEGGRAGDPPANRLAARLRELPFGVGRLKTGTPPRIDGRSVDFSRLAAQPGDRPTPYFSLWSRGDEHPRQRPCHIAWTNPRTHDIIRGALHRSPMYSGRIEGAGPRYCPSIEDKVVRFAERERHQIFVEPEGLDTEELYPNGISTSLPFETQLALVRSMDGFADAHVTRPGYAIEYDFFDPRGLRPTLETRHLGGLFFAGQINGTTGYEEAAAQGLVAGANAAATVLDAETWTPRRDEAYIGVLIDDLITQGTLEPYRMFTSRAEYRLQLREDNADLRLADAARGLGLLDQERHALVVRHREMVVSELDRLEGRWLSPAGVPRGDAERVLGAALAREQNLLELLRRPDTGYRALMTLPGSGRPIEDERAIRQVEIQAKYAGYVQRQQAQIARQARHESLALPDDLDYAAVPGLSSEVREKLARQRPATLGQAARIPGVTPAAVSLLLVHLKRSADERRSA